MPERRRRRTSLRRRDPPRLSTMTTPIPRLDRAILQFLAFIGIDQTSTGGTPADELLFLERQKDDIFRVWVAIFVAVAVMNVLWWPTDFIIFRGQPGAIRAFAIARGLSTVTTIVIVPLIAQVS